MNEESQAWYAEVNSEFPVVKGAQWGELMQQWGEFKADELNLSILVFLVDIPSLKNISHLGEWVGPAL